MSLTPSKMLPLGTTAPNFSLLDTVSGKTLSFAQVKSQTITVVMFICNHCPYVVHIIDKVCAIAKEYQNQDVLFVAISSNSVDSHPQDSPEKMTEFAHAHGFVFPYLYDETQDVAKAFDAACTPDFYVFDECDVLQYRGRFDEATPGNDKPVTGKDLKNAIDALLNGAPVNEDQKPSMGCNIKWHKI